MIREIENIVLLGTSHVAKQSVEEIKKAMETYENLEVVCLELDYRRFKALLSQGSGKAKNKITFSQMFKEYGLIIGSFLYVLSNMQEKVADSLGVHPGVEMKSAYEEARKRKLSTALIDKDIRLVMKELAKLSFLRKLKLFFRLFMTSFKKEYREQLNFDVKKGVPAQEVIEKALIILEKELPDLYTILIHKRNVHMVERLVKLREKHSGVILAVVGAGHVKGMEELLRQRFNVHSVEGNTLSYSFLVED